MENNKKISSIKDELLLLKNDLSNLDPNVTSEEIEKYNSSIENVIRQVELSDLKQKGGKTLIIISLVLLVFSVFIFYQSNNYNKEVNAKIKQVNDLSNSTDSLYKRILYNNSHIEKNYDTIIKNLEWRANIADSLLLVNYKYKDSLKKSKRKLEMADENFGIKFKEKKIGDNTVVSIYTDQELFKKANIHRGGKSKKDSVK